MLSQKFVPTKPYSQGPDDLDHSFKEFKRNAHPKLYFLAGEPIDNNPEKAYVKTSWRPPYYAISQEVDNRLYTFLKCMSLSSSAGEVYPTSYYFNYKILIWLKQHIS